MRMKLYESVKKLGQTPRAGGATHIAWIPFLRGNSACRAEPNSADGKCEGLLSRSSCMEDVALQQPLPQFL